MNRCRPTRVSSEEVLGMSRRYADPASASLVRVMASVAGLHLSGEQEVCREMESAKTERCRKVRPTRPLIPDRFLREPVAQAHICDVNRQRQTSRNLRWSDASVRDLADYVINSEGQSHRNGSLDASRCKAQSSFPPRPRR
jgi:hypothetical protein